MQAFIEGSTRSEAVMILLTHLKTDQRGVLKTVLLGANEEALICPVRWGYVLQTWTCVFSGAIAGPESEALAICIVGHLFVKLAERH